MRPVLAVVAAVASLLCLAAGSRPARAQVPSIAASQACIGDSSFVYWYVYDPDLGHPEWAGFDVLRRVMPGCDDYVRMNDQIVPRQHESNYLLRLGEPASGKAVEYRVVPVDVNRQQLFLCCGFCSPCNAFASCPPPFTSPITVGTLEELAPGFVYVVPCPGACYPSAYFDSHVPEGLAPYVGTATAVRVFGLVGCGGVEGCAITSVERWELTACVTPVATKSWGQVKAIYR